MEAESRRMPSLRPLRLSIAYDMHVAGCRRRRRTRESALRAATPLGCNVRRASVRLNLLQPPVRALMLLFSVKCNIIASDLHQLERRCTDQSGSFCVSAAQRLKCDFRCSEKLTSESRLCADGKVFPHTLALVERCAIVW